MVFCWLKLPSFFEGNIVYSCHGCTFGSCQWSSPSLPPLTVRLLLSLMSAKPTAVKIVSNPRSSVRHAICVLLASRNSPHHLGRTLAHATHLALHITNTPLLHKLLTSVGNFPTYDTHRTAGRNWRWRTSSGALSGHGYDFGSHPSSHFWHSMGLISRWVIYHLVDLSEDQGWANFDGFQEENYY